VRARFGRCQRSGAALPSREFFAKGRSGKYFSKDFFRRPNNQSSTVRPKDRLGRGGERHQRVERARVYSVDPIPESKSERILGILFDRLGRVVRRALCARRPRSDATQRIAIGPREKVGSAVTYKSRASKDDGREGHGFIELGGPLKAPNAKLSGRSVLHRVIARV
jgi:hypothetical protein